jgi:adenine-specific DNA-methyltransferase
MLMDEIFKKENRIGIINWQKAYSPKSDTGGKQGGVSSATEYVLVYSKDAGRARTGLLDRTDEMDSRYTNPDRDPDGDWSSDNPSGPSAGTHQKMVYAIQSSFNGTLHYPAEGRCWLSEKRYMRKWLEDRGSEYEEKWIDDGNAFVDKKTGKTVRVKALVLKGANFIDGQPVGPESVLAKARSAAQQTRSQGQWPKLIFTSDGEGGPRLKRYLKDIKKGKVPMTYWAGEDYDVPLQIDTQSWDHEESGHSQTGLKELDAVVARATDSRR